MSEEISREEIAALLARESEEMTREEAITEQEPCEDLISRDAALDAFNDAETMGDVFYAIQRLPSVTPKQKTGHWIKIDDFFMAKCSECGEFVDSRMISKYPYCHCGAKMEEQE